MSTTTLTVDTPPRTLAELFATTGTLLEVKLPAELDHASLESIARTHAGHPHGTCVLDLVVAHPACNPAIGVLDEQRFVIDTLLTTSGTVLRVGYPALGLAHTGRPKQQHRLMQQLRADVARELLTNPRLIREHHRWSRAVVPRQIELIEKAPALGCDEIEPMLRQETGETLYLVTTLALMRGCEIWPILSARPEALADPSLRALLTERSSSA